MQMPLQFLSSSRTQRDQEGVPAAPHPEGFNVLRILAAVSVVIGHSFLLRNPDSQFVALHFSDVNIYIGRLAVAIFFAVSGYLITASRVSSRCGKDFLSKRVRRIYPAVLVMVLIVTFIVGPFVSTAQDYFGLAGTWEFAIRNLLVIPYTYVLPGVFETNPIHFVNGVLWTLALEFLCYLAVAVFAAANVLSRKWFTPVLAALLALAGWSWLDQKLALPVSANLAEVLTMVAIFMAGSALRTWGYKGSAGTAVAVPLLLAITQIWHLPISILLTGTIPAFAISVGRMRLGRARVVTRLGDPSYGVYIWGYVLQQLIIDAFHDRISLPLMVFLSLVSSLIAGYCSWHLVERRWLSPRRRDLAT